MFIKSLNGDKLEPYGFAKELQYENPDFNGHQLGICIGILNEDNTIAKNFINMNDCSDKECDNILHSIINDVNIIKLEAEVNEFEDGIIKHRKVYYVPYAVMDHSIFLSTVNNANISENKENVVTIEVLFEYNGLNRYITHTYKTLSQSLMHYVYHDLMTNLKDTVIENHEDGYTVSGYTLDFYNEVGTRYDVNFKYIETLRDAITSVRIIEITTIE